MQKTENAHRGSTLDSFLHEEGIYHQVTTAAVLEVFVEEACEEMERQKRSQSWLARKMGTNRRSGLRFHHLKIVSTPGGIGYEVSGKIFRSPSTAAKSITNTAVNGWVFWRRDRGAGRKGPSSK